MGPCSRLEHLLGTWPLHALVTDAEGHCICPKPEPTWTWDREECSPQPSPPLIFGEKKKYWRGAVSRSSRISLKCEGLSSFCADLSTASNRKLLRVLKNLQAPVTPGSTGEPASALVSAWGAGAEPPGRSVPRCAGGWCPLEGRGVPQMWYNGSLHSLLASNVCGATSPLCPWRFLSKSAVLVRNKAPTTLSPLHISPGTLPDFL